MHSPSFCIFSTSFGEYRGEYVRLLQTGGRRATRGSITSLNRLDFSELRPPQSFDGSQTVGSGKEPVGKVDWHQVQSAREELYGGNAAPALTTDLSCSADAEARLPRRLGAETLVGAAEGLQTPRGAKKERRRKRFGLW